MKPVYIIPIIFIAVILSSALFNKRVRNEKKDIDIISQSLSGASPFIKPGSSISFVGEKDIIELFSIARYILAPAYITKYNNNTKADTLLSIQNKKSADTTLANLLSGRHILWSNEDSLYTYQITSIN